MKKIFLSLSAIALLAAGTVSCGGSDDSGSNPTPPIDNPDTPTPAEQTANTIFYDGEEYSVDYQHTGIEFTTYQTEDGTFTGPNIYTTQAEPTKAFEKYTQLTAKITNNSLTDYTVYSYYAYNPTVTYNAAGELTSLGSLLSPAQVDEMIFNSAGLRLGGVVLHNSLGALNDGEIEYSSYVVGEELTDTAEEFEYLSTATYFSTVEFEDATITTKAVANEGYFYGELVDDTDAKLPSGLSKKLSKNDQDKLKAAIKASRAKADLNSNFKLYKGKVALKK